MTRSSAIKMLEKQKRQITKITVPNHIFIPLGLHSKENYAHSRPAFLIFFILFLIDKEEYILKKRCQKRDQRYTGQPSSLALTFFGKINKIKAIQQTHLRNLCTSKQEKGSCQPLRINSPMPNQNKKKL